jgi:hypothetical protein
MTINFLVMHLNLKSFYYSSIILFLSLVWMNFIFENKKIFSYNIFNMCSFAWFFFLFDQFNLCLYFYYRLLK